MTNGLDWLLTEALELLLGLLIAAGVVLVIDIEDHPGRE
jgi:hypothetical protein